MLTFYVIRGGYRIIFLDTLFIFRLVIKFGQTKSPLRGFLNVLLIFLQIKQNVGLRLLQQQLPSSQQHYLEMMLCLLTQHNHIWS